MHSIRSRSCVVVTVAVGKSGKLAQFCALALLASVTKVALRTIIVQIKFALMRNICPPLDLLQLDPVAPKQDRLDEFFPVSFDRSGSFSKLTCSSSAS